MCIQCFRDEGYTYDNSLRVRVGLRLAARVYEFSGVGGALHIVLDDMNVERESVEWCLGSEGRGIPLPEGEEWDVTEACGRYLLLLTENERANVALRCA